MTEQQKQYIYWEKIRNQQLHRIFAANFCQENKFDVIKRVSDDYFLNYIEYDCNNISPDKANARFMNTNLVNMGMCTGVHKNNMVLRQLDWYYNNEAEFIIKMKGDRNKGIYSSIGVTASSPKLTVEIVKNQLKNNPYNEYFDLLPYMTVDGVNEKGIFAQSNVVEKNGIFPIDINPESRNDCCCSIMLVRFILDHVGNIDELEDYLNTLHLYSAPEKFIAYNNHIMVADKDGHNKIIEFNKNDQGKFYFELFDYPVMTNFRVNGGFSHIGGNIDWNSVEWNGIGLERWEQAYKFIDNHDTMSFENFKELRHSLNYTHAYDRPVVLSSWLTDNLSGDLSVIEAKKYHDDQLSGTRKEIYDNVLSGYERMYIEKKRKTGKTWHTTHSCIYDLENLSMNIQSQQNKCWNVTFDGKITEDK